MKTDLLDLQKQRRSIYALGKNVDQSPEEIADFIKETIKQAPTPFNSQSTRAVILFNDYHKKLWDIVLNNLKPHLKSEDAVKATTEKINSFSNAFGTVLYFTDMDVVHDLENQFPAYADNFYDWSEQSQGNAQYAVWTGLAENGIGANLQHYNPLIDEDVTKEFGIPESWKLRSEMDFGSIESPAGDKDYMDDDKRFKLFK
ncbi:MULTISPECIES: nitroreductase family protein [Apilactobacillus]|uniref:Nitroreductase n=1 Tax=Apilactobacillus micheneri TaxID=1899430 RepID=A0A9Q8IPJ8_9LACO|nr:MULTISPECIES: nitroreductase family protein [Apilactobacillus]TPR18183.1 nitroreductase [Apilactobacillus timberlakei]TPR18872.1 nitroreductase [Apilactobacillus timberlakei]TPR20964.1 nitroreductase [Apilactobacillus timberlakei]TPR23615.1 nitroreductase [Apilactobacillus timberlakei]TPR24966.1 nitroreductase [Apilactobacillus timberlakei]